jgi:F0F1-type ATP synthase assembly protein I
MPDDKKERREALRRYARLSGIGLQMGVTIFLGAQLGRYLDGKYPSDKKWWTIGLTLFAVVASLYSVLRQVNRLNDEEKKK